MDNLIADSVSILKEDDNLEVAYGWMDAGDVICEKLRSGQLLKEQELILTDRLTSMLKTITLDGTITLYRGLTGIFDHIVAGKQFNAMSPNLKTAATYGPNVMKIIVPRGSNALYISAWELLNAEVEEQEEKEVLLLPGKFTLCGEEEGLTTYLYIN